MCRTGLFTYIHPVHNPHPYGIIDNCCILAKQGADKMRTRKRKNSQTIKKWAAPQPWNTLTLYKPKQKEEAAATKKTPAN